MSAASLASRKQHVRIDGLRVSAGITCVSSHHRLLPALGPATACCVEGGRARVSIGRAAWLQEPPRHQNGHPLFFFPCCLCRALLQDPAATGNAASPSTFEFDLPSASLAEQNITTRANLPQLVGVGTAAAMLVSISSHPVLLRGHNCKLCIPQLHVTEVRCRQAAPYQPSCKPDALCCRSSLATVFMA